MSAGGAPEDTSRRTSAKLVDDGFRGGATSTVAAMDARCSAVFDYDKLNELMRSICCTRVCKVTSEFCISLEPRPVKLSLRAADQFYFNHVPAGLVDKDHSMLFIEDREVLHIILAREEHPGFDFSGAEFNGNVPNAREFMGGVQYK
ncbi:hypothetical protein Pmar_PMAR018485 [Perkinsus marinus ATCC 50983]|uniref:Uncharacterized protein n=1 Tax=Perkinsus marinus (strain ATCC 50983 / TXsc) TaxID=423536 RepID=C5KZY5_PERM5|nr:hypothetical protein Pmar_PMAR018485 [Perkinsus marinus ATCC 50983]EER09843.1 hypothetical protein Pmar_PMAR018485 [Perkinsus marinus ATCC 50983]|eukprot:XP_002778048.1 hypothetical protein Pmar_PMAR018485 [Perkinsus marinus ATCC 50983]